MGEWRVAKNSFDGVEDVRAVFGLEDLPAEGGAAGDAVGEPGGELLHFAESFAAGGLAGALGFDLFGVWLRGRGGMTGSGWSSCSARSISK